MLYMERIDVRTEEGVAILSRHPIVNHDYILLFRYVTRAVGQLREQWTVSLGMSQTWRTHTRGSVYMLKYSLPTL